MKSSLIDLCAEVYKKINSLPDDANFTFKSLIDEYGLYGEEAVWFIYEIMEMFQGKLVSLNKTSCEQKFVDMPITKIGGAKFKTTPLLKA